jgi:hypothetical protein
MSYPTNVVEFPSPFDGKFRQLPEEQQKLEHSGLLPVPSTAAALEICLATLKRLKDHVLNNAFDSEEAKIFFFKHVKPRFLGRLVYFQLLISLKATCLWTERMQKPRSSRKD